MGRAKRLFSLVLLFVITFSLTAVFGDIKVLAKTVSGVDNDDVSVEFTGQNEGYTSFLYNNSNGLPTSEANAIAETEEGFIWIGSYSGLIRYDGNTFERMDSTTGIASITALYVDSKNRLWIGTNDNGTAVLDKGEYKYFKDINSSQSLSVRSIVEDKAGNILIATTRGIEIIDEYQNLYRLDSDSINDAFIHELRMDDNTGIIYGITQEGDVFTIQNCKITGFYDESVFGFKDASCILPDPNNPGFIYIGTDNSNCFYGELDGGFETIKEISVDPLKKINSIEYLDNKLWICADNGIGVNDNAGFRQIYNIPMNNSIDQMITDYEGNLWFASSRQGVLKIVRNRFTDIFAKYGIDEAVVNTTARYKSFLLMGTDDGLIAVEGGSQASYMVIRGKNNIPKKMDPDNTSNLLKLLEGVRIRSVIRDSEDILWISTYSDLGLLKYEDGTLTSFNKDSNGLPSNKVRAVYECKDKTIYVACSGGLVVLDNKSAVKEVIDTDSGLGNQEVLTVTEGFNGETVMGTDGGGIYVKKGNNIEGIGLKEGLSSMVVLRIKRDEKRNLYWIITSNSIAYMTADFEVVTVKNFPYSNNFDMFENSKGEMWVIASNGIYVAKTDELINNDVINPTYFSIFNGLTSVATANSYSELTENGDLYVAGSTGVSKVNIEIEFADVVDIKMAVPFVNADGVDIYPDESGVITIPPHTKRVTVYGYVYTYSLINPQVTYYLEGFDKDERTVSRKDFEPVTYTNLRGKTYHFVMKLDDALNPGENELSVTIVKQKAFHETLLFYVLAAVIAVFALYELIVYVVHKKTRNYLKKQEENKLFIKEMTEAIARTIDMKDRYTKGHSTRVAEYTAMLAKELGYDEDTVEKYYNIALLHDIGKIGIKPEVLNKNGKLTDEEFTLIKSHSIQGYNVLKDISIMPELATGARSHHERPDGKGYPDGLKDDEIPRAAQIIAVADTFDAMYSNRPYRNRMNFDKVVSTIKEVSGTQLTKDVVDAFLRLVEQGKFKDPGDTGGGSEDDIDNIHKRQNEESEKPEDEK